MTGSEENMLTFIFVGILYYNIRIYVLIRLAEFVLVLSLDLLLNREGKIIWRKNVDRVKAVSINTRMVFGQRKLRFKVNTSPSISKLSGNAEIGLRKRAIKLMVG